MLAVTYTHTYIHTCVNSMKSWQNLISWSGQWSWWCSSCWRKDTRRRPWRPDNRRKQVPYVLYVRMYVLYVCMVVMLNNLDRTRLCRWAGLWLPEPYHPHHPLCSVYKVCWRYFVGIPYNLLGRWCVYVCAAKRRFFWSTISPFCASKGCRSYFLRTTTTTIPL